VISRRYQLQRSIVLTTNKVFGEWNQVFPNAACVVTFVDRLVHRAEIVAFEGKSWRLKEAAARVAKRASSEQSPLCLVAGWRSLTRPRVEEFQVAARDPTKINNLAHTSYLIFKSCVRSKANSVSISPQAHLPRG
jgi:hypothetical protein